MVLSVASPGYMINAMVVDVQSNKVGKYSNHVEPGCYPGDVP